MKGLAGGKKIKQQTASSDAAVEWRKLQLDNWKNKKENRLMNEQVHIDGQCSNDFKIPNFHTQWDKYSDMYTNPIKGSKLEHRDVVLDILSDARVVGPLMQTGLFHAEVNRRNYMYVFGHNSFGGPHASLREPRLERTAVS
uniref:Uncharacterized protein n=1 Tax=Glossina pallidipes TaxID=7398 RepID=A0A1A9ZUH2_GLOPL